MIFSLLSDIVTLFTLHIFMFYRINARLYHWQLGVLSSLFNLFRGKKYNVLRNRLDSCDYGTEYIFSYVQLNYCRFGSITTGNNFFYIIVFSDSNRYCLLRFVCTGKLMIIFS